MIYATYNVETGELLGVAAEIKPTSGYPLQVAMLDFDYPIDFGRYEWMPNLATFAPKAAARRLTKIQFRDRFTGYEKVGIEFAALDTPTAPIEDRLRAAQLRVFLADVASTEPEPDGTSVDLDDPRTVAGVQALEAFGLIAPGRATEVLA